MESPKGSLARLLEVMIAEIGYVETPDNITKFGKAFRADGKPWCGSFQNWCEKQSGVPVINTVSTINGEHFYKEKNALHKTPKVGDLGFMNFTGGKKPEHVARVIEVTDPSKEARRAFLSAKLIEDDQKYLEPMVEATDGYVIKIERNSTSLKLRVICLFNTESII
jgi:hypothetical protein